MSKKNLLDLGFQALANYFKEWGEPAYRAQQVIQWIHQRRVTDFNGMTNLTKNLRTRLIEETEIVFPEITYEHTAQDGTHKWLLRLADGNIIETVYIPDRDRGTLCVSSQIGCALNCSFCSTGKQGFNRNMTLSELISQLWIATGKFKVTNVVFMGMGEPLLNYEVVLPAIELMLNDLAYGLSKYRVTLSTSGVLPVMEKLKRDTPVALAVSLHAPNDALRDELVPINKKYPLASLMEVCKNYYPKESKRQITFEYVMLDKINDTRQHADQLIRLLQGVPSKINLIPFNPFPKTQYGTSSWEAIDAFQQRLMQAGIDTRVRRTRGDDIDAACGQLAGQFSDRTGRHARWLRTGRLVPDRTETN